MPYSSKDKQRAWYAANRERLIKYATDWQKTHPEQVKATDRKRYAANPAKYIEASRSYRKRYPDRVRTTRIKAQYGISGAQLDAIFETQGRRCGCCHGTEHKGLNWHVDHDHVTGLVRGILCSPCNTGIGALGDNLVGLAQAEAYLNRHYDLSSPAVEEHY